MGIFCEVDACLGKLCASKSTEWAPGNRDDTVVDEEADKVWLSEAWEDANLVARRWNLGVSQYVGKELSVKV